MIKPTPIQCPECKSQRVWQDGTRQTRNGKVQRHICRECGYRFSETSIHRRLYRTILRRRQPSGELKQNCAPIIVEKNLLAASESQMGAGTTKPTMVEIKGKIIEFMWYLKKEGYAESTILKRSRNLRKLVKLGANLFSPENVKEMIAEQSSWSVSTKANIVDTYTTFVRMLGLSWKPPRYKQQRSFPFIPTEAEIDALVACCGNKTSTFIQLLKETAMRSGEAFTLEWCNIDTERRLVNLKHPEKGSFPRIFKISAKLVDMLNHLPKKSKRVFGTSTLSSLRGNLLRFKKEGC